MTKRSEGWKCKIMSTSGIIWYRAEIIKGWTNLGCYKITYLSTMFFYHFFQFFLLFNIDIGFKTEIEPTKHKFTIKYDVIRWEFGCYLMHDVFLCLEFSQLFKQSVFFLNLQYSDVIWVMQMKFMNAMK